MDPGFSTASRLYSTRWLLEIACLWRWTALSSSCRFPVLSKCISLYDRNLELSPSLGQLEVHCKFIENPRDTTLPSGTAANFIPKPKWYCSWCDIFMLSIQSGRWNYLQFRGSNVDNVSVNNWSSSFNVSLHPVEVTYWGYCSPTECCIILIVGCSAAFRVIVE